MTIIKLTRIDLGCNRYDGWIFDVYYVVPSFSQRGKQVIIVRPFYRGRSRLREVKHFVQGQTTPNWYVILPKLELSLLKSLSLPLSLLFSYRGCNNEADVDGRQELSKTMDSI